MKPPKFSVVIPTLNRADLIGYAIQSVLDQTFKDFELIVYDNCSEDNTRGVVENFKDPRIKYFCADRYRPPAGNWECGRKLAIGDYIIMMNDDDALVGIALEELDRQAGECAPDLIVCNFSEYLSGEIRGVLADKVVCPSFTGKATLISKEGYLRPFFSLDLAYPSHPSCVVFSRAIAKKIEDRCGYLFCQPAPEYFAWGAVAALAERMTYIDLPLIILGRTLKSWGVQAVLFNQGEESLEEMRKRDERECGIEHAPLKIRNLTNARSEALFQLKACFPSELSSYEIDHDTYVRCHSDEIIGRIANGVNMSDAVEALKNYLHAYSPSLETKFNEDVGKAERKKQMGFLRRKSLILYENLDEIAEYIKYLFIWIKRDVHRLGLLGPGFIYRFNNVYGCAKVVERIMEREHIPGPKTKKSHCGE